MALCHGLLGKRQAWRTAARSGTRSAAELRTESHAFEAMGPWFCLSGGVVSEQASRTLTRLFAYEHCGAERGCFHSESYADPSGCAPGYADARGSVRPVDSCRGQRWSGIGGSSPDQLSNASLLRESARVRFRHPVRSFTYCCADRRCYCFVHRLDSSRRLWRCFAGFHYTGILRGGAGDLAAHPAKTLTIALWDLPSLPCGRSSPGPCEP